MWRFIAWIALAPVIACSGSSGEAAVDGGELDAGRDDAAPGDACGRSVAFEDLFHCGRLAGCQVLSACLGPGYEFDSCVQAQLSLFSQFVDAALEPFVADALADGRVTYDPDAAGACLARRRAADCLDHARGLPPLATCGLTGTIGDGEPCFATVECAGGGHCLRDPECGFDLCCPGVCLAPAALGEECNPRLCEGDNLCVDNVCRTGTAGSPCVFDFNCRGDHHCDNNACVASAATGSPCDRDGQCTFPDRCLEGLCQPSYRDGDPCDGFCNLLFASYCDQPDPPALGTCRALPALGEDCSATGTCGFFAVCDSGGSDLCERRADVDEPCASVFECQLHLFCDHDLVVGDMGTCRRPQPSGSPCSFGSHCESGICRSGQCVDYDSCE